MPAKGTSTGAKRNWLGVITIGLSILGGDATNKHLEYWLRSLDGRAQWNSFATELPTPGTLKNYFTDARNTKTDAEGPWSIGKTSRGDAGAVIPAEALPDVLMVKARSLAGGRTLTVRQARWVARLRHIYPDKQHDTGSSEFRSQLLYSVAAMYSASEQISEAFGTGGGPDTSSLDAMLAFGASPYDPPKVAEVTYDVALALRLVGPVELGDTFSGFIDDDFAQMILSASATCALEEVRGTEEQPEMSLSFWQQNALLIGMRAIQITRNWDERNYEGMLRSVSKLRRAVLDGDWSTYRELTGVDEIPGSPEEG